MTQNQDKEKVDIEVLRRAFDSFNQVTHQLQESYEKLQKRIQEMDIELAQKNAELEQNLKEKEEVKNHLNNILQSLTSGVVVVDREHRITTINPAVGAITGESTDPCLGKTLTEAFGTGLFETLVTRLKHSATDFLTLEREFVSRDGRRLNLWVSASPVADGEDQRMGTVLVVQDTTQLKRLEEEVQRNRRLRAMGEMAAGIAHEIRNPLGSIELCASLLRDDLKADAEKKQLAENICNGVNNMDRIISSILLFARSPQPSRQKCDVNLLLNDLIDFSSSLTLPGHIRIIRDLAPGGMPGNADSELLKQVFLNLIRNAIQAMEQGGQLRIATEQSAAGPGGQRRFITITVSDTGQGIEAENLLKIFNPFFTTKDKGTGLGLAIAHNIIKAHQGTIDVESVPDQGTTFIVKIPCWGEDPYEIQR